MVVGVTNYLKLHIATNFLLKILPSIVVYAM